MLTQAMLDVSQLRRRLLTWYDVHRRDLPWRARAENGQGERPDPYRVWLSEIMLQQTTVAHAAPYFLEFTRRWPTVTALARADAGEVMAAWAGLGYYARARNLMACAAEVAGALRGVFPETEGALRALPGIGAYTAAAVAAIAFDEPCNVVDANVERVMARLFAVETPLPTAKPELTRLAAGLVRKDRPGDWAQALMDLGAVVCRPAAPLCGQCPLARACRARAAGAPEGWPRRTPKAPRPQRHGVAYVLTRDGEVGLVRRPPRGLLGGMLALPTSEWRDTPLPAADALAAAPLSASWRAAGVVDHVFTHFALRLTVYARRGGSRGAALIWTPLQEAETSMPSLFRKALKSALAA